uniref:PX domain-containing protein n=1 Tax=Canis lupus familiaris TaxID=9615 RepID=A0A8C0QJM4_CANLF
RRWGRGRRRARAPPRPAPPRPRPAAAQRGSQSALRAERRGGRDRRGRGAGPRAVLGARARRRRAGPRAGAPGLAARGVGGRRPRRGDHGAARAGAVRLQVGEPGRDLAAGARGAEPVQRAGHRGLARGGQQPRRPRPLPGLVRAGDPRPRARPRPRPRPRGRRRPRGPGSLRQRPARRLRAPAPAPAPARRAARLRLPAAGRGLPVRRGRPAAASPAALRRRLPGQPGQRRRLGRRVGRQLHRGGRAGRAGRRRLPGPRRLVGPGAAGRYRLSTRSDLSLGARGGAAPQHPPSGAKSSATVSRNLNRFSTFVKSGGEAFVLGEASGFVKDGDKLCVVLGPYGPEWQENPYPFQCTIDDPTKQTKFKGMKSYISYKLVPTHTQVPVHRRYKHFDWLYARLAEKFPVISVPHLPEKQATGRFEEDFISKRRKGLIWWMNHMASHPVLAQCDVFQHFLTCPSSTDEKAWKQGKRKAEKDEMVGANFFLTLSTPPAAALDLQEVESKIDGFKCFTKKMDDSALQLNHTANEFARKQVTGFKKEYQKVGQSFRGLSQAFELDQQAFSAGLNQAIAFTGDAYDAIGELFAEQPRQDLDPVMDLLALYQGHLANFPDIIHVQKGALTKVKESRRHVEEGKMEVQKADGIQDRCNTISFATLAEIHHFHQIRVRDFKSQMQHFLQQQIIFFQKVTQKLEEALHKYDSV